MNFRFRLTFHHISSGFFHFEDEAKSFQIDGGPELILVARDADALSKASRFHLEGRGFPDEETAREAGERLRLCLRVLNSLLGLGIDVPTIDKTSGGVSDEVKEKVLLENNGIVLDNIVGLAVFPDDDKYFEYVMAGVGNVYPSDPSFLFKALGQVWQLEMQLDERAQDALEILGRATTETSPRARFLLTYLATERMVDRSSRSEHAKNLIKEFQKQVRCAGLDSKEADSLCGALAYLNEQSFPSALFGLVENIDDPPELKGRRMRDFLSECVSARNKIAHNAILGPEINLPELADGLRQFVMTLIWTQNHIPSISIDVPASAVSIPDGGLSIRVR
jgi:hypothetical protein